MTSLHDGAPTITRQDCIPDDDLDYDDFTDASSHCTQCSEEDCDCHEEYVCEWHSWPGRHDKLHEEALYVFKGRCVSNGPNPSKHYSILSALFVPVMSENIHSMREYHMSEECFLSLFLNTVMFAISEPALNHTKYRKFILNMFAKTRELREKYPWNHDIQRAYRNWSKFILDLK